jgi:hypothetical protein
MKTSTSNICKTGRTDLWTKEEIDYLRQNYRKVLVKDIIIILKRSKDAIICKAKKLGLSTDYKDEKNPNWNGKGGEKRVGYSGVHAWVRRRKVKPKFCEECKINKPYDLANVSGEYKRDINDFRWLCRSCHMNKDGRINNLKQNMEKNGK